MSASIRGTFGALLGTIATTAQAVTQTVDTAAFGVSMLDVSIRKMAAEQLIQTDADMGMMEARILDESAKSEAERAQEIAEYRARSVDHAHYFDEAHARLSKLVAEGKAKRLATAKKA